MFGYVLILVAAVLWALLGVFTRGALDLGVSAMEIAFWRAVIGGGVFVAHALATDKLRLRRRRDLGVFGLFSLLGVSLFFTAINSAVATGGISLAVILLYTAPAFVAIGAWALLGESLTLRKLGLVGLVIVGVALVARDSGSGVHISATSVAWGLTAGLSYASFFIFGKHILERYRPVTVYAFILPLGALGLLPFVDFAAKTPQAWGLLGLMGVLSTYLSYLAYYTGLEHVEATRASLVATIEPVVAAGLAAVIYGERFGVWGFAGAALILAASVVSVVTDRPAEDGV